MSEPPTKRVRANVRPSEIRAFVYNVSHIDVLLSVSEENSTDDPFIGRPNFSSFRELCLLLSDNLQTTHPKKVVNFPSQSLGDIPTGFNVQFPPGLDWDALYLKSKDYERAKRSQPLIHAVFFPLIAIIIPKWLKRLPLTSHKVLYLVSGSGKPRNPQHDQNANSTLYASRLIASFVHHCYPAIEIEELFSGDGIFRFDENISFLNTELRPRLELRRQSLADGSDTWASRFKLTLGLSSGAPARVIAINSSLKGFHPDYMHIWQLKRFWHDFPTIDCLHDEDVDVHEYEKIDASPAVLVSDSSDEIRLLVKHMRAHRDAFREAQAGRSNELRTFWLRKTHKPVLGVLMVRRNKRAGSRPSSSEPSHSFGSVCASEGDYMFYRGMNLEVSMPTGSLCAERNAISTALAADLSLSRSDFVMLGVLSMDMPSPDASPSLSHTNPISSPPPALELSPPHPGVLARRGTMEGIFPVARNPLSPCGACQEWLRKVAEVNPMFRIITFTDTTCASVFVHGVE